MEWDLLHSARLRATHPAWLQFSCSPRNDFDELRGLDCLPSARVRPDGRVKVLIFIWSPGAKVHNYDVFFI